MMNALEEMYQTVILDEYRNPRGKVAKVEAEFQSHQYNPTCGDDITVGITVRDDKILEVVWSGSGCSISLASASIATDLFTQRSIEEAHALIALFKELMNSRGEGLDDKKMDKLENAVAFTGTSKFPGRIKCALLAWLGILGSIEKFGTFSHKLGCE
ncbi:MAG: SUF system NifU family Fe-S cluster assembly protein [Candidatus Ancillula sp.]|jgi:nitrogen fixation NifU-like protein|nr:SUF system NifU family Fe-S cluster assembly protein [Candidatus Ancillula sp.]